MNGSQEKRQKVLLVVETDRGSESWCFSRSCINVDSVGSGRDGDGWISEAEGHSPFGSSVLEVGQHLLWQGDFGERIIFFCQCWLLFLPDDGTSIVVTWDTVGLALNVSLRRGHSLVIHLLQNGVVPKGTVLQVDRDEIHIALHLLTVDPQCGFADGRVERDVRGFERENRPVGIVDVASFGTNFGLVRAVS
jgi:hypothetical protein